MAGTANDGGGSWEDQKRRRNRLAALPLRRDKLLATIDLAEARRKVIEALYASARGGGVPVDVADVAG